MCPTDPAGNYTLPPSYFAQPGTTIRTEQHNPILEDLAQGVSGRLMRDGRNGMVGPLGMGGFPIRNVQPGQSPTDAATVGQGVPVGALMDYAGANAPEGWLLCYGQAVSRTTYAALFAVIGTTYGAGNGSTTFNVPDLRGRVVAGVNNMGGTDAGRLSSATISPNANTLGGAGGQQSVQLSVAQMPAHTHSVSGSTNSTGAHSHNMAQAEGGYGPAASVVRSMSNASGNALNNTSTAGAHSHSVTGTAASQGSGAAHPNVQPTMCLNKIIRATY